jgi:hypothetical protein
MTKNERVEAEVAMALTLRGATNESSKAAVEAALAHLENDDTYEELAEDIWNRVAKAVIDEGIVCGVLDQADRDRLVETICTRLSSALREVPDEDA